MKKPQTDPEGSAHTTSVPPTCPECLKHRSESPHVMCRHCRREYVWAQRRRRIAESRLQPILDFFGGN